MRYSITVKFISFLLAAVLVVACGFCMTAIVFLESNELYTSDLLTQEDQWYQTLGHRIAWNAAQRYASEVLGQGSNALLDSLYSRESREGSAYWHVTIARDGQILREVSRPIDEGTVLTFHIPTEYLVAEEIDDIGKNPPDANTAVVPSETVKSPENLPQERSEPYVQKETASPDIRPLYRNEVTVWERGSQTTYLLHYYTGPTYQVTVTMTEAAFTRTSFGSLIRMYPYRMHFIGGLVVCLILLAASLVFLFISAARDRDGSLHPGGLTKAPLDLYLAVVALLEWGLITGFVRLLRWIGGSELNPGNLSLLLTCATGISLLAISYLYTVAAQVKISDKYWWHNSVLGRMLDGIFRGAALCGKGIMTVVQMIPLLWQWVLTAFVMALFVTVTFCLAMLTHGGIQIFWGVAFGLCLAVCLGIVGYGGYSFGILLMGAKKMADGDLSYKIPTKYLFGSYRQHALRINSLSETAMIAAQKHLKSERTKTELITNVSHDIKTPLTSIISFVDLLKKPHTEQEEQQYLDVLSRQSMGLKRLIEDLMDLSKANTGNMPVSITKLDAAETVNQALGEFSDKLASAQLTPVFHCPENPLNILADGRLTWRVLANLLGNAVKYANPGTRLYVDLHDAGDSAVLSLKNISREELKVTPDELMERFRQGDSSRSTEGSGLGLNIARSLMEVQGGHFRLMLDGDLFKVTLIFPKAP